MPAMSIQSTSGLLTSSACRCLCISGKAYDATAESQSDDRADFAARASDSRHRCLSCQWKHRVPAAYAGFDLLFPLELCSVCYRFILSDSWLEEVRGCGRVDAVVVVFGQSDFLLLVPRTDDCRFRVFYSRAEEDWHASRLTKR